MLSHVFYSSVWSKTKYVYQLDFLKKNTSLQRFSAIVYVSGWSPLIMICENKPEWCVDKWRGPFYPYAFYVRWSFEYILVCGTWDFISKVQLILYHFYGVFPNVRRRTCTLPISVMIDKCLSLLRARNVNIYFWYLWYWSCSIISANTFTLLNP